MLALLRGRNMLLLRMRSVRRTPAGRKRVGLPVPLPDSAEIYGATDCDPTRVLLLVVMFASLASAASATSTTGTWAALARTTRTTGRFREQLSGQTGHEDKRDDDPFSRPLTGKETA